MALECTGYDADVPRMIRAGEQLPNASKKATPAAKKSKAKATPTPTKRKRVVASNEESDGVPATPSRRNLPGRSARKKVKYEESDSD